MYTARAIEKALKKLGSTQKAKGSAWFFKTGKGQYGYGDIFYGVTVPEQRNIARTFYETPLSELQKLLNHKVHECRLTALLILGDQYTKRNKNEKEKIISFYLKNTKRINNWDLVDASAPYILGEQLLNHNKKVLYTLARSKNIWERRIAIVATHAFIKKGKFIDTLAITKLLMKDKEDLLHKACGWMLREVGKKDEKVLEGFLARHAVGMPRTMLRYALERFPERKRMAYMALGKKLSRA